MNLTLPLVVTDQGVISIEDSGEPSDPRIERRVVACMQGLEFRHEEQRANAARIVLCVNACEGISDNELKNVLARTAKEKELERCVLMLEDIIAQTDGNALEWIHQARRGHGPIFQRIDEARHTLTHETPT